MNNSFLIIRLSTLSSEHCVYDKHRWSSCLLYSYLRAVRFFFDFFDLSITIRTFHKRSSSTFANLCHLQPFSTLLVYNSHAKLWKICLITSFRSMYVYRHGFYKDRRNTANEPSHVGGRVQTSPSKYLGVLKMGAELRSLHYLFSLLFSAND